MADYMDEEKKEQPSGIDERQLEAIVSQQIELAKAHDSQERENDRAKALDYYLGRMDAYVPPEPNRSKVVSRDVADVVGWIMPQIMRVFTASDKMAIAEPVGEEDTKFASQATDGLNYVFWKENKGYEIVYSATWDALVAANGIVKTYYDDTPVYSTSFHSDLSEDQLALLLEPDEEGEAPEVLAQSEEPIFIQDEMTGEQIQSVKYDVKIRRKKHDGRFVIDTIPPERFLIDQDAVFTDEAAFTAHWEKKTRSELVAMGYDKDEIAAIPEAGTNQTSEEAARNPTQTDQDIDSSMTLVDYYECFIRIDVDDDGEAELVRACFAGSQNGKLLDWEVWEDEHPFDDIPCEPVPHRWVARSIADETMDVQDIKTVLLRQGLNNTYWVNNPQRLARGKVQNPDELVNPTFGGIVWGEANTTIDPLEVPFVAQSAFEAIAYQDEVVQRRTGVGRSTMALDPETLQNQTATANQNQKDAGYSQVELLARNMAEWGWKKVFRKLMRLMIKHQDRPRQLMINKKSVTIDPRFWNADMDVTINVGLGTGSRDRDLAMLSKILETQLAMADRFVGLGAMEDAIDMLPKILHTMTKMAESAGIRNPEEFYPEYTEDRVMALKQMAAQRAQEPSPEMQKEMAKAQAQGQLEQMKIEKEKEFKQWEMQANRDKEMAQMEADLTTSAQTQGFEQYKFEQEMALKREEMERKFRVEMLKLKAAAKAGEPSVDISGEDDEEPNEIGLAEYVKMTLEMNQQLLASIQRTAALAAAPRESQLVPQPDGSKKAVSRLIMEQ